MMDELKKSDACLFAVCDCVMLPEKPNTGKVSLRRYIK